MAHLVDESYDEVMEVETEEETQRKKKTRRLTITNNGGKTSSSTPAKRTGRRPDEEAWKHVEKLGNEFKCNHCKKVYAGGASRIKEHLGLIDHKGNIKRCPDYLHFVDEATNNVGATTSSLERETKCDSNPDIPLAPTPSNPQLHSNPTLPSEPNSLSPQFDPPSVVPSLSSPSLPREAVINEAHKILPMEVKQYIREVKESWATTGLTLKIHFRNKRYIEFSEEPNIVGYTMYCPKGVIFLDFHSVCSEVEKAIDKEVTQIIYDLDDEEDIQHVLSSCSRIMLLPNFSNNVPVCAHGVILELLYRLCEECSWLSDPLMEAKSMYEALRKRNEVPPVESNFKHPFFELQAIMRQKEELKNAFSYRGETFKTKFWKDGEDALNVVRPLIQFLNLFDNFVPNIAYFYEALGKVEKRIKNCCDMVPEQFEGLWELFGQLKSHLIMPIHVVSAYLNPIYMCNESSLEDEISDQEVQKHFKDFMLRSEDEEELDNELMKYNSKDPSLFTEDAILMLKTYHPVKWWEKFGERVPLLRRCAIRLLSQPSNCLSHLCHRPQFEVLNFEEPIVFELNVRMMKEFKELEERDEIFKPIDVSIIDAPLL